MKLWIPLLLLAGATLMGSTRAVEESRPRDPTVDSHLTISDWTKAADDISATLSPDKDDASKRALETFKQNLDTNKNSSMEPSELQFALVELRHGHPYLETAVLRKIRENNPITP